MNSLRTAAACAALLVPAAFGIDTSKLKPAGYVSDFTWGSVVTIAPPASETPYTLEAADTVTKLQRLSRIGAFHNLDPGALVEIARSAEVRIYPKACYLFRQGDVSKDAYILDTGAAEVYLEKDDGTTILLRSLSDGAILGELGVAKERIRTEEWG